MYSVGLSSIGAGKCLKLLLHKYFIFMLTHITKKLQQVKIQFVNLQNVRKEY